MEVGRSGAGARRGRRLALVLLAGLAACSTGPSRLATQPLGGYPARDARGGIHLGVEAFLAKEQAADAFAGGDEFRARGLLPVRVLIENRGAGPIRIDPGDAALAHPRRGRVPSLAPVDALAMVRVPVGWWALGGDVVGGTAQGYRNEARRRDIEGRALQAQTVPAGASASGFLYFAVPETEAGTAGTLLLSVQDAAGRPVGLEVSLQTPRDPATAAAGALAPAAPPRPGVILGTGGKGVIIRSPAP